MKITANKEKLTGLGLLFAYLVINYTPDNMAEKLVYAHVYRIHLKIKAKLDVLNYPKGGYNINLTDDEAIALYLFMQNVSIPENHYRYEAIQMRLITDEIDKIHA